MNKESVEVENSVDVSVEIVKGVTINSIAPKLHAIKQFQELIRTQLIEGHDFGVIPGAGNKPTLFKAGAEKIAKLLSCADRYEIIQQVENWDKPLFAYTIKCSLLNIGSEVLISEGIGECNSYESKYRYRWVYDNEIPIHLSKEDLMYKTYKSKAGNNYRKYRIENDDIFSQKNTLLKMAKKRALVDAALSAGRLSDLFTQDIEDIKESIAIKPDVDYPEIDETKKEVKAETPKAEPVKQEKPKDTKMSTQEQIKAISVILQSGGRDMVSETKKIVEKYKVDVFTELTYDEASKIIKSYQPKRDK